MIPQTVIIASKKARETAMGLVQYAPQGCVVTVRPPARSTDQNALMHSLLSDLSRQKVEGRHWTPDTWKAALMNAAGHQVQFEMGIDNSGPFPVGFRSSRLSKEQMAKLLTCILEYGDRHGVKWTLDPRGQE